jgi:predicted Zn-dependent protease
VAEPISACYGPETVRIAAALLLALAPACSPDSTIDITFDPCSHLAILPLDGTKAAEVQAIEDAVAAWSQVIPARIDVDAAAGDGALTVSFESGDTPFRAMYFDHWGEIMVSRDKLAPGDYALALAHELGHAFGLQHVDQSERPSVMNVGNLSISPTEEDGLAVTALWQSCVVPPGG